MSQFSHEENFVPGADYGGEYLRYPGLSPLLRVFLEVEEPVQGDEVLQDGLHHELEPSQQLKHREVCGMFSIAENHLGLQLVLVNRAQVISFTDSSRVASDVLIIHICWQTSPLLLGQFNVVIADNFF